MATYVVPPPNGDSEVPPVLQESYDKIARIVEEIDLDGPHFQELQEKYRQKQLEGSINLEELAIGIAIKRPELTVEEIAKMVGRSRGTLYRWPRFKQVFSTMREISKEHRKAITPRGVKSFDEDQSTLEAWEA